MNMGRHREDLCKKCEKEWIKSLELVPESEETNFMTDDDLDKIINAKRPLEMTAKVLENYAPRPKL